MHSHELCASPAGTTRITFADDPFTQAALDERRGHAKHAHIAGALAAVVGSVIFLGLARAFVRAVR